MRRLGENLSLFMVTSDELEKEVVALRKEISLMKFLLIAIQEELKTALMHRQGVYGIIDNAQKTINPFFY